MAMLKGLDLVGIGIGGSCGHRVGCGGNDDELAPCPEIRDEVLDLRVGEHAAEGGHTEASIANLERDLRFVHALANPLQIGAATSSDACGTMAVRASVVRKDLRAALLGA